MRHVRKEWYTCNRCGNKIDETPSNVLMRIFKRMEFGTPLDIELLAATKTGYVTETKLIAPNIAAAEIVESYNGERETIHFCGKCRKAFKRFMNGM